MGKFFYNTGVGCLGSIMSLFLGSIIYTVSYAFIETPFYVGFPIAFLLANFMVSAGLEYSTKGKATAKALRIISAIFGLSLIFIVRNQIDKFDESQFMKDQEQKVAVKDSIIDGEMVKLASHTRNWKDYLGNNYSGELNVKMKDYYTSTRFHNGLDISYSENQFWGKLYETIKVEDQEKLDLIMDELSRLRRDNKLNRRTFAEMIVSCIQDIPYSLVLSDKCENAEEYDPLVREILNDCPECCIGSKKYGIQTPIEFMVNLKGDCDTRTVMAYTILDYFGYKVAILNSDFYKHSILGIDLPSKGLYKSHRGTRYYLWETTNKYFKIGELSSNLDNTNYWHVVLKN